MAFYTVAHKIKRYKLKPSQLTIEFWDYILLGKGDPRQVAEKTDVPVRVLEELRREFDYWYPLDSRHSGKDLIPNHLTFFIYNHVAIFPEEKWPRQIVVNGWLLLCGLKMSKSKGNVIPLRVIARVYGPDTVRAAILLAAEVGQDANFTDELADSVLEQLRRLEQFIYRLAELGKEAPREPGKLTLADKWMLSRLQRHIAHVTKDMEELRLRDAANVVLYLLEQDVKKYLDLVSKDLDNPDRRKTIAWVAGKIVDAWVRMLSPITPHLAEEMWSRIGGEGFVSLAEWPKAEESLIDEDAEAAMTLADIVVEDVRRIIKAVGKEKPRLVAIYTAPPQGYTLLHKAIKDIQSGRKAGEFIKAIVEEAKDRQRAAEEAKKIYELAARLPRELQDYIAKKGSIDEYNTLSSLKEYIAKQLGARKVTIQHADTPETPNHREKRKAALPTRPAIHIEF
jgi:leucyl-tRNA synthetase